MSLSLIEEALADNLTVGSVWRFGYDGKNRIALVLEEACQAETILTWTFGHGYRRYLISKIESAFNVSDKALQFVDGEEKSLDEIATDYQNRGCETYLLETKGYYGDPASKYSETLYVVKL